VNIPHLFEYVNPIFSYISALAMIKSAHKQQLTVQKIQRTVTSGNVTQVNGRPNINKFWKVFTA